MPARGGGPARALSACRALLVLAAASEFAAHARRSPARPRGASSSSASEATSPRRASVRLASARAALIPAPRLLSRLFKTVVQHMLRVRRRPPVRKQLRQ